MIYLCTALYPEAQPFLTLAALKKNNGYTAFQLFEGDNVKLIVTGVGKLNAATAIACLFSLYPPCQDDILVNYGVCGAKTECAKTGETFLCNKITDRETRVSRYPDVLFPPPFSERGIETCSSPANAEDTCESLFDMEAFGIYHAAQFFLAPHRMLFCKTVSDYGANETPSAADILSITSEAAPTVFHYAQEVSRLIPNAKPVLTETEQAALNNCGNALRLTTTMSLQLRQAAIYRKLCGKELLDILQQNTVECMEKNDGKKQFEHILTHLSGETGAIPPGDR